MDIARDIDLIYEIGCLRYNKRHWSRYLNPNFQNLSEHIFRVAWIAMILAQYEKVKSTDKILKMAILHDLTESRTVDVDYLSRKYVTRLEKEALDDSLKGTSVEEECKELYKEFEEKKTKEAQIVRDADYLDTEMELLEQEAQGHNLRKVWEKFRLKASKEKFFTDTAKKFYEAIQRSEPHNWQIRAQQGN
jgi:putative hydrolase of HD superfamily